MILQNHRCWNLQSNALEWTATAIGTFRRLGEPPQPSEGHGEGITRFVG